MKTIELSEADGTIAEYACEALSEPITFTLDGKPVAFNAWAVGSDEETIALSASVKLRRIIERSRESYRRYGGISQEEMRRQSGRGRSKSIVRSDPKPTALPSNGGG